VKSDVPGKNETGVAARRLAPFPAAPGLRRQQGLPSATRALLARLHRALRYTPAIAASQAHTFATGAAPSEAREPVHRIASDVQPLAAYSIDDAARRGAGNLAI